NGARVPPEIAAEVFETQEKLAELRGASGPDTEPLRDMRERLSTRLAALRDALVAAYDGGDPPPDELRRRLAEIAHLRTLLGDIEDALGEGLRGTHHRH